LLRSLLQAKRAAGLGNDRSQSARIGRSVDGSPQFKKRLLVPEPAQRQVFLDEGLSSPDAYATRYVEPRWWDQPITRHGDGNTFSYADGHSEYHKWKGIETIQQGRNNVRTWGGNFAPATEGGLEDLQWVQRGIWGKLGYKK